MSIRCAMCGSKNVYVETKKEGYNLKAGVIGTALVGAPGALAGTVGNDTKYYHCRECGQTLNKPMMSVESDWIDSWITNPKLYNTELKRMKSKYRNIEWEENDLKTISKITIRPEFSHLSPQQSFVESLYAELKHRGISLIEERELEQMIVNDDAWRLSLALQHLELAGKVILKKNGENTYVSLVTNTDDIKKRSAEAKEKKKTKEQQKDKLLESLMPRFFTLFTDNPEEIYDFDDVQYGFADLLTEREIDILGMGRSTVYEILDYLKEKNLIESVYGKARYALVGMTEKLEEKRIREEEEIKKKNEEIRKENEEIEKRNAEIRAKIDELKKERKVVEDIISANKNKLFGAGVKARKEAQARLEEIISENFKLSSEIQLAKKYLSL